MSSDNLSYSELHSINKRHEQIRGSNELKYPPRELRCENGCGHLHYETQGVAGKVYKEHPCFLAIEHQGECEFSSECADLLIRFAAA